MAACTQWTCHLKVSPTGVIKVIYLVLRDVYYHQESGTKITAHTFSYTFGLLLKHLYVAHEKKEQRTNTKYNLYFPCHQYNKTANV